FVCIFVMFDDMIYYFFFQAEDGIRDRNVTGVQTCALPISVSMGSGQIPSRPAAAASSAPPSAGATPPVAFAVDAMVPPRAVRSRWGAVCEELSGMGRV